MLLPICAAVLLRLWEQVGIPGAEPAGARAYVVQAVDGDTIEVRIGDQLEDVRYIEVDTPETVKPGTPVQCFRHRASDFDHYLVEHRRVRLIFGVERDDSYGCWPMCTSLTGSSTPSWSGAASPGLWRSRPIRSTERFSCICRGSGAGRPWPLGACEP